MELKEAWSIIEEVISSGGEFSISPSGTSMLPLIRPGKDVVVLVAQLSLRKVISYFTLDLMVSLFYID